jgi:hypothetical protein
VPETSDAVFETQNDSVGIGNGFGNGKVIIGSTTDTAWHVNVWFTIALAGMLAGMFAENATWPLASVIPSGMMAGLETRSDRLPPPGSEIEVLPEPPTASAQTAWAGAPLTSTVTVWPALIVPVIDRVEHWATQGRLIATIATRHMINPRIQTLLQTKRTRRGTAGAYSTHLAKVFLRATISSKPPDKLLEMAPPDVFVFSLLSEQLAICRLAPDAPVPPWPSGPFVSITRTPDELSIVCDERAVPASVRCVRGRRALGIRGVVDFSTIGVIAGLTRPLAAAGISVFVVSTYDTDWILVQDPDLAKTLAVLRAEGHAVA